MKTAAAFSSACSQLLPCSTLETCDEVVQQHLELTPANILHAVAVKGSAVLSATGTDLHM